MKIFSNDTNQNKQRIFENLKSQLPPFMGVDEACKTFGVSRSTISRLRAEGTLTDCKAGISKKSRVVIIVEELLSLLERSTTRE